MNSKKWWVLLVVVLLIGGSIGGKILYDAKKERDRQDLLHIGDRLEKSLSDYENTVNQINDDKELAEEYTNLMESIIDEDFAASELDEMIAKACKMESELMEIYPTVYKEPSSVCD
ncbi:hypothetical protein [Paenibacillus rhizoplanae]|uniref:Uncharacterized protein n=1 Tax=Paenibacillus rhizoplanae TaxID=1917181 RepID=A0ABW5FAM7_9BACL